MFLYVFGIGAETADFFEQTKNVQPGIMAKYLDGFQGPDAVTVAILQELPESRGSITLRSSDPFDPNVIDPNCFSDSVTDLEPMVVGKIGKYLE